MKTLSRRCGAPASAADTTCHSASNPRSARSPSTAPSARRADSSPLSPRHHGHGSMLLSAPALRRPRTFSRRTSCGRSTSIAVATQDHTPVLVPARSPFLAPAQETSWHGKPAVRISTGSTASQLTAVMSPRFGTDGKRRARIAAAPGSLSATHAGSAPSTACTARSRPPYPVHRLPVRVMRHRHAPACIPVSPRGTRTGCTSRRPGQA
jgi:hypothetical protein